MTPKQRRFVDEFLIDLNATQAAVRAGYSPKTARGQGARMATKGHTAEAIAAAMAARAERTETSQDAVLAALVRVRDDAMTQVQDALGNRAMRNHSAALRAIELIGRHIGMWPTRITHEAGEGIGDRLDQAMRAIFPDPTDGLH